MTMRIRPCQLPCIPAITATLLALASSATVAQSSVSLYGLIDVGVQLNTTGAPGSEWTKAMTSGNQSASRLGFRGSEDLGGGLQAIFNLEAGINTDAGDIAGYGTTAFFARRSVVGLKGNFGQVMLGREYTPGFWNVHQLDRHAFGLPGTISTASQLQDSRADNGIFYTSPSFGGVTGRLSYAFGESVAGKLLAGSVEYRDDRLFASAAVQRRDVLAKPSLSSGNNLEGGFGLGYKFGRVSTNAGFWKTDVHATQSGALQATKSIWVGLGITSGVHALYGQVARTEFDRIGAAGGRAFNYGVAYNYTLSKRTNLYAAYGGTNNDAGSSMALQTGSVRVGGSVRGADPRALVVGVRHSF